ncbi:hypothetical protein DL769_008396 [Monosporascus sp. CRB-8-3]|nr:hypothetical protein DL769_008396 [Monosporascus sp. CRB-8-3]
MPFMLTKRDGNKRLEKAKVKATATHCQAVHDEEPAPHEVDAVGLDLEDARPLRLGKNAKGQQVSDYQTVILQLVQRSPGPPASQNAIRVVDLLKKALFGTVKARNKTLRGAWGVDGGAAVNEAK